MRLQIFDDVGVAAAGVGFFKGFDRDWTRVACAEGEVLTKCYGGFLTNTDQLKLINANMSSERVPHSDECVIGVFLNIVEWLHSRSTTNIRDAFSWLMQSPCQTRVIAIALLVSEIWLATERQTTHTHTHTHTEHTHARARVVSFSSVQFAKS